MTHDEAINDLKLMLEDLKKLGEWYDNLFGNLTCKCGGTEFLKIYDDFIQCQDCKRFWIEDTLRGVS